MIECKADNVTIKAADYAQGEAYALYCNAPFFVTHNNRETRYWRTRKDRMPGNVEEIENIPHTVASDKDIQELIAKLKTFKEDEFADLLHSCHNVIRNREHLDPAAAFDEIAKVLFIKVWVERNCAASDNGKTCSRPIGLIPSSAKTRCKSCSGKQRKPTARIESSTNAKG